MLEWCGVQEHFQLRLNQYRIPTEGKFGGGFSSHICFDSNFTYFNGVSILLFKKMITKMFYKNENHFFWNEWWISSEDMRQNSSEKKQAKFKELHTERSSFPSTDHNLTKNKKTTYTVSHKRVTVIYLLSYSFQEEKVSHFTYLLSLLLN